MMNKWDKTRTLLVKNPELSIFQIAEVVKSCLGTKIISNWMDLAVKIALDAVKTIHVSKAGVNEIDIKRYCR